MRVDTNLLASLAALVAATRAQEPSFEKRVVGPYDLIGCGSPQQYQSYFRRVASLNNPKIFPEVCGAICHEKYVATQKG